MRWQNLVLISSLAQILSAGTIHFQNGDLTQSLNLSDYLTDGSLHFRPGVSHYLLAFNGPIGQDQFDLLAAAGATVTEFVPDNSLVVAASNSFNPTSLNLLYATRLRPEQKRSPISTLTSIVEFHTDVDPATANALLTQSGLTVLQHPDLLKNHFMVLGSTAGLEQWDEVDYIFPASSDLIAGRHVYACSSVISGKGVVPMFVTVNHGWTTSGLGGVTLQYTFNDLTTKVAADLVMSEITRALNRWPRVANVHFTPGTDPLAPQTVAVKFAEYDHGDGYPFDGPGGILAHTFYPVPTNAEPIAGDMHLDGSENWNVGADTDIYTVALHEAGHALGLAHTTNISALMYPYYHLGEELTSDDIAGVQSLYGPPNNSAPDPATPAPVTPVPTTPAPTPTAPTPISLTIQNPTGKALQTTATTQAISGAVANAVGSPVVTWQTDRGLAGTATGSSAWSISSVALAIGINTITITATDTTHATSTQAIQITRNAVPATPSAPTPPAPTPTTPTGPDTVPPSISISSPASTILQTGNTTISVSGTASDNVGVAKITWQNTLSGSGTASGTNVWCADAIPLYPGSNTLILRAYDAAGNSSWRSLTVIRQ